MELRSRLGAWLANQTAAVAVSLVWSRAAVSRPRVQNDGVSDCLRALRDCQLSGSHCGRQELRATASPNLGEKAAWTGPCGSPQRSWSSRLAS